jgi:hypothetical protein
MNCRQALGFFATGAVLALVPRLAPGLCPFSGMDGSSTRMIWLQLMSLVLLGLGLSYFARRTLVGLGSLLEYAPRAEGAYAGATRVAVPAAHAHLAFRPVTLSPLGVALENTLLDQRRAA